MHEIGCIFVVIGFKYENMKTKSLIFTALLLLFVLNACQEDSFSPGSKKDGRLITNYSRSDLNTRVRIPEYEEILPFYDVHTEATNARINTSQVAPEDNYVLVLRAEVNPPPYLEQMLKASHVHIDGNRAFVAYNTEGENYLGGIEIYDISNMQKPVLIAQIVVNDADYSALTYHDNKIYLAGATQSTEDKDLSSPAIVEIISLENDQVVEETALLDIMGFAATDVKIEGDKLYVTSGTNGGLSIYDLYSLELLETKMLDDARSIAFDQDQFVVMQGTPARIKVYNTPDGSLLESFTVGGANIPESKSIVDMKDNMIFIPAGSEGLKVIDAKTGQNKLHIPLPEMENVKPEFMVTNGASVNEDRTFIANGAAGLYVARQQNETIRILGSVEFNASTNYVKSKDNVIFVATGTGGLKILEIMEYNPENGDYITIGDWDKQGVPSYLCERESPVSQNLSDNFFSEFISRDNIIPRHPEWFATDAITDLHIQEDTDITIAFFHEAAGMLNTFGYYAYPGVTPPMTADEIQNFTVLFPNTSYVSKGGGLIRGDKICLNNIEAGTTLGFFLVANGFKGKVLTKGHHIHHTTTSFNRNRPKGMKQHSLLLYDEGSDTIILTFENLGRPGGDKDFEDAVFLISLSNPDAVDTSNLTRLK